jgi:glycogen phosphorylase
VRALAALGHKPTVWHINEGHAAFLVLERMRAMVQQGIDFPTARAVAANTVFTTHTPVPAGHDHFAEDMMTPLLRALCGRTGLPQEDLLALGRTRDGHEFNMTALAIRGSRFHNGVSRIHGGVSSQILCSRCGRRSIPTTTRSVYVTNGVHVPTFLAQEWGDVFERYLGFDWATTSPMSGFWDQVDAIPDHLFWSVRQSLKAQMLHLVRHRVARSTSATRAPRRTSTAC